MDKAAILSSSGDTDCAAERIVGTTEVNKKRRNMRTTATVAMCVSHIRAEDARLVIAETARFLLANGFSLPKMPPQANRASPACPESIAHSGALSF